MSDTFDHEGDAWESRDMDFWDNDWEGGYFPRYRAPPRLPHCRKCGAICMWTFGPSGWRLYSDGGPHYCVARVDDFDILED